MKRLYVLMGGLVLSLALTSCAVPNQPTTAMPVESTQSLNHPNQLVEMNMTHGSGNKLDLKSQALGKPSIMIFWASW